MADQMEQYDETSFNNKYWFKNTHIITVVNPRTEDYVFQATLDVGIDHTTGKNVAETRSYRVAAGGKERFPGPIANMYLDQMSKMIAQDEDKIQYMIDYSLKAQYYDQLIVAIEDLINSYTPFPEYLDKPAEATTEKPVEQPFSTAQSPQEPVAEPKKLGRPPKATTEV